MLVAEGLSAAEAAGRLGIAPSTVRSCLHVAYGRLGVHGAVQAVALACRRGWDGPWLRRTVGVEAELARALDRLARLREEAEPLALYLRAFDAFLRGEPRGREAMAAALAAVLAGAGAGEGAKGRPRHSERDLRDLLDLLCDREEDT